MAFFTNWFRAKQPPTGIPEGKRGVIVIIDGKGRVEMIQRVGRNAGEAIADLYHAQCALSPESLAEIQAAIRQAGLTIREDPRPEGGER